MYDQATVGSQENYLNESNGIRREKATTLLREFLTA